MRVLFLLLLCPSPLFSQSISTYLQTNNNGIYTVLANPANAAGSTDWLSINLVGAGAGIENNILRTRLHYSLAEIAVLKPVIYNQPSFSSPYFETAKGIGKKPGLFINTQVLLPSFKVNITPKFSFFFYLRERVIGNIIDAGQDFLALAVDQRIPTTVSPALQLNLRMMNLQETGAGISAVLFDKRETMIKAGITVKRTLARFACIINTKEFEATPGMGGINISARYRMLLPDFTILAKNNADFALGKTAPGQGYSADIGIVYEHRPYKLKHRYRVANPRGKNNNFKQRDVNKYLYRISASVSDIGYLLYSDKNASDKEYKIATTIDPQNPPLAKNFMESLTKDAEVVTEKKQTKLYMPTTALIALDYRLHNKWYLNIAYTQNLRNKKKDDVFYIPTTFTGMLRKETRSVTLGMPLRLVPYTRTATVGWFTQAGPFFIGTDNVLTLFKRKLYNWSLYTGICFTIKYKKDPTIETFKGL